MNNSRQRFEESLSAIETWEPYIGAFVELTTGEAERQVAAIEMNDDLQQQPLADSKSRGAVHAQLPLAPPALANPPTA